MAQVTIRDVAAAAGVSVSTVSLSLNAPHRVAAATRERVIAAADTLGFVPKAEAVARARRGVGRVGAVGPFTTYPAAAARLGGVLRAAPRHGLEVVVFDQPSAARTPAPLLASLPRSGRLDGLLIVSQPLDEPVVARLIELDLPAVLVDMRHPGLGSVRTDDTAGGRRAAAHLLERGHRRVAFLGESQRSHAYVSPAERRLAGFAAAFAEAGHPVDDARRAATVRDPAAAAAAARELLTAPGRPTAVFASDDLLAAAVLAAARQLGLAVPGELAVVGYDDGELAAVLELTTVRQPLAETGELALERLHRRMRHAEPAADIVLDCTLVPRATT
ncbi:LacI family transcriptional regulator [Sphaerisporangium rufum]|uniref:LacI family transcriptional regulator n=1 Tax=Sphaerisporangium rufum TaxID=1381558 RepID=A0A919R1D6_9ACTN|nr:LacI family DNA-binding transcriptional regulator [Sphaerisporangium rufum]GII77964.1 LacI family transcriptional regulator [Sphaerisporangium rufum]